MTDNNEDHGYAIPAASIANINIGAIESRSRKAACEIRRLGNLMEKGEDTKEDLGQLIQLLFEMDEKTEAEYLLRRNLEIGEESHTLYLKLFGKQKIKLFREAIAGFATQFHTELAIREESDFLDETYLLPPYQTIPPLPSGPCEVRFDFSERDFVSSDVCQLEGNEYVVLKWVEDQWRHLHDEDIKIPMHTDCDYHS